MGKRQEEGAEGLWHGRSEIDSLALDVRTIICIHLCHPGLSVGTFHKCFCNSRLIFLREKNYQQV